MIVSSKSVENRVTSLPSATHAAHSTGECQRPCGANSRCLAVCRNLFAQHNDDTTMRAMMHAFVDKSRSVGGVPKSLADVGYLSVGMDDGFQRCNCSTPQGPFPHSLTNVSCSVNDCRQGRCTWHNQTDGTPMIDEIRFPDLKGLVQYAHSLALQIGFYLNTCICMEKGRTYFEEDVAFLKEMQFDTVKIVRTLGLHTQF